MKTAVFTVVCSTNRARDMEIARSPAVRCGRDGRVALWCCSCVGWRARRLATKHIPELSMPQQGALPAAAAAAAACGSEHGGSSDHGDGGAAARASQNGSNNFSPECPAQSDAGVSAAAPRDAGSPCSPNPGSGVNKVCAELMRDARVVAPVCVASAPCLTARVVFFCAVHLFSMRSCLGWPVCV